MPIRALVFDFDGLILDTETPEFEAWQTVFSRHGIDFPEQWWVHAIGRGAEQITETPTDLLERLTGQAIDHTVVNAEYLGLKMTSIYLKEILPGVRELVSEARSSGVRVGVASSSSHSWVDAHLHRLGLFESFEAVLCADDVSRAKPYPDLYLAACSALKTEPSEAVAIEDSPNGIRAAKDAGLGCLAVPNSLTKGLDLSLADAVVESLQGVTLAALGKMVSR